MMLLDMLVFYGLLSTLLTANGCDALSPRLYGVNYSLKKGPDWDPDRCKNRDQVAADLRQLKDEVTDRVRLFSMGDCDTAAIVLSLASEMELQVWLGLWVGPDQGGFNEERQKLLDLMSDDDTYNFSNVLGIHVSSEAIYRGEITVDQAIELRNTIRADVDQAGWTEIPVTVCDIIDTNLVHPELSLLDSSVTTFNMFPFWERTINITNAKDYMAYRVAMIESQIQSADQQIIITETGWADAGSNPDANQADPVSMAKWMRDFVCLTNERGWQYFWFDAYDSDWRRVQENMTNDVEGHFGIYHANGTMKSILQGLEINCDDGNPKFTNMPTASPDKSQTQSPATTAPVPIPTATPVLTTSNPTKSPISQPTTLPSTSPVQALSQSPTVFEVLSEAPSDVAVEESIAPTKTPVARPQSLPIQPVPNTTTVPIPTQKSKAPSSSPREENLSQCQLNSACAARNLTGQCCPTTDDWTLACCGAGPVEELCQGNDKCAALELTGSCCPTTDGKHLDCCEVVPDACLLNGTDSAECQRYSTTQYKLELRQKSNSSESSTGHANMSSRSLLLLLFCLPSFALALNNYL